MLTYMRGRLALFTLLLFQVSCGISYYPGQPGIVTNGTAKIDLEVLDGSGLWVYEVDYDNRIGGSGVKSIVTKLYKGALTYTTNVRTNADGTLFRHKFESRNAEIQMISFPQKKQIIFPDDSLVKLLAMYEISSDEVDDRNVAESDIFSKEDDLYSLTSTALKRIAQKIDWIKAGEVQPNGRLSYRIVEVELGGKIFQLSQPVVLETNVIQTGVFINLGEETKTQFVAFLDEFFPSGFEGTGQVTLDNAKKLEIPLNLKTRQSLSSTTTSEILVMNQRQIRKIHSNE